MNQENDKTSQKLIHDLKFCVIDLETTGGNHKNDKIIEIGLVQIDGLEIGKELSFQINPEIQVPEFILKLTSLNLQTLQSSPRIEDVIEKVLDFIGERILVAHNSAFDIPFLNSVLKRLGKHELKNNVLCTNLMTKYLIPSIVSSNLNYMSKLFGIQHHKAHRALEDARATAELLITFLKIFIEKRIKKINHLYYPKNKYELDRIHFKNISEIERIKFIVENMEQSGHVQLKGEKGLLIYNLPVLNFKNEANEILAIAQNNNWETMTLHLMGSFFESLLNLNLHFPKLEENVRMSIIENIYKKLDLKENMLNEKDLDNINFGQFLIVPHLVPEQYIVYPIFCLGAKNDLIFRFPSHKKKLLQFLKSNQKKFQGFKREKHFNYIHKDLQNLVLSYLFKWQSKTKDEFIFIDVKQKINDQWLEEFEKSLALKTAYSNYPQIHF